MHKLLLVFLLISGSVAAQRTTQLVDALSGEAIPFAKIVPKPGNPALADIDGLFVVPENATEIAVFAQGYLDTIIPANAIGERILLRAEANELEEVVILPGVNPAERIIELAMANRKKNHPMGEDAFSCTSYSKFVFTLDPDALAQISDTVTDSNLISLKSFFGQQHLFLLESTTEKYFEPPYREKEIITAYRVSGFSDPAFSTFANEMQSFNFYENQFNLLGKTYVNPLAFGGIRRYLFILEDQTVTNGDTTFTIRFQPRRDKNFEALKGWLYINSNGYAVEKVIAEPQTDSKTATPKIIQEYAFIDGKKWFPVKLSTEILFQGVELDDQLKDAYLIGKGSTYIDYIKIGADLSNQRFNAVMLQTAEDANEKDSTHWNDQRKFALTDKELRTYEMIDSLSEKHRLDQRFSSFFSLLEGKIPIGPVQIDLLRVLDYHAYEGTRLGLGLENSKKLMKHVTVGGYFGYGLKDKEWKYGGYSSWMLFPKQFIQLQASFQQDLIERGGYSFLSQGRGLSLSSSTRHLFVQNMERQRKAELALSGYLTPRIKLLVAGNYQRIGLTGGYSYNSPDQGLFSGDRTFDQAEASAELVWTIRENVMYIGDKRISRGSLFPKITAKVAQGIAGIEQSAFDYSRFNVDIQQDIEIRAVGKLSYLISAGKTIGDVPMYLQQVAPGTGGDWNLSVMNSFETMPASTFYNQEQVAVFTRFMFKPFKTNKKWSTPQIGFHHAYGIGNFRNNDQHQFTDADGIVSNLPFSGMEKGYAEAGIILDKLINLNTSGFGIGVFYNYGNYNAPKVEDNIMFKLSLSFIIQ